jgi:hypothetical protein
MRRLYKYLSFATAVLGLMLGVAGPTRADLTLVMQPGPGVDITHLTVGQTYEVDIIGEGTTPGEHIVSGGGGIFLLTGPIQVQSTDLGPHINDDLTTHPVVITLDIIASTPGSGTISTQNTTFNTNLATYSNLASGPLSYTVIAAVSVPEPSTAVVAAFGGVAFIAYGWSRHRREQRRQAAA